MADAVEPNAGTGAQPPPDHHQPRDGAAARQANRGLLLEKMTKTVIQSASTTAFPESTVLQIAMFERMTRRCFATSIPWATGRRLAGSCPALVVKELVDNALDAVGSSSTGAIDADGVYVEDHGGGLPGTDGEVAALFSVSRPCPVPNSAPAHPRCPGQRASRGGCGPRAGIRR